MVLKKLLRTLGAKAKVNQEPFIALMQVAMDDARIRHQLVEILSQPQQLRLNLLHKWISELTVEQAPGELISALEFLTDEAVANKALATLKDKT